MAFLVHKLGAEFIYDSFTVAGPLRRARRTGGVERDLIRTSGEGRDRAKVRGVKRGRKPKLTPHQMKEAIKRRYAGEGMRDIGKSFNVSHSTISRLTV